MLFNDKLSNYIAAEAEKMDISAIPSKASELHRLFYSARDSILALMIFSKKVGVALDDQLLPMILNSFLRDENEGRTVNTWLNGRLVNIDIDKLDTANAARLALAEQYGVSEQDFLRYEQQISDLQYPSISVPCNHRGCSMFKSVRFGNSAEMVGAEHRASTEIWFCHHHSRAAFEHDGALSDDMFPILHRIKKSPGTTQKNTGAKREEIAFLTDIGLVRADKITQGSRVLMYKIFLTDEGESVISKFSTT